MNGIGLMFPQESTHIKSDVIFIVHTLIDNSYKPISMQEFNDSYCKNINQVMC